MNSPRCPRRTSALGCLLACCGWGALILSAGEAASPAFQTEWVSLDNPIAADVRAIGETATKRIAASLLEDASSSVASYSLSDAVRYCHLKSLPDTGPLMPDLPRVSAVKLTAPKLRNPANAPDAGEQAALEHLRADADAGHPLTPILIQRLQKPDGTTEWRVYRPIVLARRCEGCHGDADSQSQSLRLALHDQYPTDAAVGYKVGQWRGVVRVTVEVEPPPASQTAAKR